MNDLKYRLPDAADKKKLAALSRDNIGMTDVYTYVRLHPEAETASRLWTGGDGEIEAVIYDDGSYFTVNDIRNGAFTAAMSVKNRSLFVPPRRKYRLAVMEYGGNGAEPSKNAVPLTGKDIISALRLMSGEEKLPDYLEKRYVDIVRGINAGLYAYYGVFENGALVSCGGIVASNEKYALLGNIFTKEEYRRRGLASDIVKTLVNDSVKKGLIPILYCEKRMTGFYEKLCDFSQNGIYDLRSENHSISDIINSAVRGCRKRF